jgi:beta-galactosidase
LLFGADYYYYSAWWKMDPTSLHINPSDWNAPVPVGHALDAVVYSAAAEVELTVNGKSLGRQPVPPFGLVRYVHGDCGDASLIVCAW